MTIYYIVTVSAPGYLPNVEPVVIADEQPPTGVLAYMRDEVERISPEPVFEGEDSTNFDRTTDAWDKLYADIASDLERAADFDASAGFLYRLPDGDAIAAAAFTREQIIELGYVPGEDFDT